MYDVLILYHTFQIIDEVSKIIEWISYLSCLCPQETLYLQHIVLAVKDAAAVMAKYVCGSSEFRRE